MKKLLTVFVAVITAFTMMTTNVLAGEEAGKFVHVNDDKDVIALDDFSIKEGYTVKRGKEVLKDKKPLEDYVNKLIKDYKADTDEIKNVCGKEAHEHKKNDCYGAEVFMHQDGIYYYDKQDNNTSNPVDMSSVNVVEETNKEGKGTGKYFILKCEKEVHKHDDSCYRVVVDVEKTLNVYTVTFDANGGLFEGEEETVTSVTRETSVEKDYLINAPVVYKDGYAFVGWAKKEAKPKDKEAVVDAVEQKEELEDPKKPKEEIVIVDVDGEFKESVELVATWEEIPADGLQVGFSYTPSNADLAKIDDIKANHHPFGKNDTVELSLN